MLLKYYIYKNETTILNTELFVCLHEVSDLKIGEFKIYIVYIALHMFFKHVISMCVCVEGWIHPPNLFHAVKFQNSMVMQVNDVTCFTPLLVLL